MREPNTKRANKMNMSSSAKAGTGFPWQIGRARRAGSWWPLILVLALVVGAYFLVTALHTNGQLEDCLMSGRKNCAPIAGRLLFVARRNGDGLAIVPVSTALS